MACRCGGSAASLRLDGSGRGSRTCAWVAVDCTPDSLDPCCSVDSRSGITKVQAWME